VIIFQRLFSSDSDIENDDEQQQPLPTKQSIVHVNDTTKNKSTPLLFTIRSDASSPIDKNETITTESIQKHSHRNSRPDSIVVSPSIVQQTKTTNEMLKHAEIGSTLFKSTDQPVEQTNSSDTISQHVKSSSTSNVSQTSVRSILPVQLRSSDNDQQQQATSRNLTPMDNISTRLMHRDSRLTDLSHSQVSASSIDHDKQRSKSTDDNKILSPSMSPVNRTMQLATSFQDEMPHSPSHLHTFKSNVHSRIDAGECRTIIKYEHVTYHVRPIVVKRTSTSSSSTHRQDRLRSTK
jgi:hypothetical protein